jgi:hypothetical protein
MEEPVDGLVCDALRIENIPRDQHEVDSVFGCQARESFDGLESSFREKSGIVGLELSEQLADLPVGGVQ